MAKQDCLPLLALSLFLTGAPAAIEASSLSISGNTSATFCEGPTCGPNTPNADGTTYNGPYSPSSLLSGNILSSSCVFGCIVTNSVANSNFGVANNQTIINASSGPSFNPAINGAATADASWSDKITFLKDGEYIFTLATNVIDDCVGTLCGSINGGSGSTVTINGTVINARNCPSLLSCIITLRLTAAAGQVMSLSDDVESNFFFQSPFGNPSNATESFDVFVQTIVRIDPSVLIAPDFSSLTSSDPYYTTESGYSYLTPQSSVPEVSTGLLGGLGLSAIVAMSFRRRSRLPVRRS